MAIKIGINGFGRISRVIVRIAAAEPEKFDIAAINYRDVHSIRTFQRNS